MEPLALGQLIILVLALVAAGFSWRSVACWCCLGIAAIDLAMMLHIGPW